MKRRKVWLIFGAALFIFVNSSSLRASAVQSSDWHDAHCTLSQEDQKNESAFDQSQAQARGKNLRKDLNNTYEKLTKGIDGYPIPKNEQDVTSVVLKYINVGMRFSDAESILNFAGFSVDQKPGFVLYRNDGKDEKLFLLGADITPFSQHFLGRTDLMVLLFPQNNSDFSRVCDLSAGFLESSL